MKTVVITGSTRGIGLGLATAFLNLGCRVMVSSRTADAVARARDHLQQSFPADAVGGHPCDVTDITQVQSLWDAAVAQFGQVDIWINNAGMGNPTLPLWKQDPQRMKTVVNTNILGVLNGSHVALNGMLAQGFGALYNMEGFGSDGRTMAGFTIYGSTKYAVRYIDTSLLKETADTPIIVGSLSPGMVVTDLLLVDRDKDPERFESQKRIFNILADRAETVTPFLAKKVLENKKTGAKINWLTPGKIAFRFLAARFRSRDLFADDAS